MNSLSNPDLKVDAMLTNRLASCVLTQEFDTVLNYKKGVQIKVGLKEVGD